MTVTTGVLARAVIYEGRAVDRSRRPDHRHLERLGEVEQQIQVTIDGTALATTTWASVDVVFDVEFIDGSRGQRFSNVVDPVFTYGVVIDGDPGAMDPVIVTVCVRSYSVDDRGVTVGATVSIGATVFPLAGSELGFSGYVNLVWQGMGCLPNDVSEPDFTT